MRPAWTLGSKTEIVWELGSLYINPQDKLSSTELRISKWWQLESHNYDQDCCYWA